MDKPTLIQKIKSLEGLTGEERAVLIELINTKKKYGLVWEDKLEDVEEQLRSQLPVLIEVPERRILAKDLPQAVISSEQSITEEPTLFDGTKTSEIAMAPSPLGEGRGEVAPNHILIEGDNLHALTALTFTHEGKIDLIYIDPPYNTGNKDFKYNDSFVDKEDTYRHSKWLSFMEKRLRIAKRLLSDKGVIFISIDDNEQAQLRLLSDEVFGEGNFVADAIIETATDNNPRQIAIEHEYLIVYAKNITQQGKWGIVNYGAELIQNEFELLKEKYYTDYQLINSDLKTFIKENYDELNVYKVTHYQYADDKGVYFRGDVSNTKLGGYDIDLIHPVTKKVCKKPPSGYRFKNDTLAKMVEDGDIDFGEDENKIVTVKRRMNKIQEKFRSIYYEDGRGATSQLKGIFGSKVFNNPKSIKLLDRIFKFSTHDKAIILDFFAGSGTTLHATMQLNTEDGGNRQCILVTNNENNICEEVTYERNKRVIQGYSNAKGVQVPGLTNNNLRYYKSKFVPSAKNEQNKRLLTHASTDLLCIKEDCYNDITAAQGFNAAHCRIFTNNMGKYMVVVYHSRNQLSVIEQLIVFIQSLENLSDKVKLYAFSPEKETLLEDFYEVADLIDAVPLPEAIYNAYRATFRTLKLDKKPVSPFEATEALTDANESEIAFPTQDEA